MNNIVPRFDGHLHTMYSNTKFVDAINKPKELIDRAIELGLKGIAITDHSGLGAHVVANQYAQQVQEQYPDFKVALGEEGYLCKTREKGNYYFHQIWIAKDKIGHKMIREMSSTSWIKGYYDRGIFRTPILWDEVQEIVEKYGRGHIIASSACLAGTANHNLQLMIEAEQAGDTVARKKHHKEIVEYVQFMKSLFGDDFYLEVAPGRSDEQIAVNSRMSSLSKAFGVKMVCFSDAHYLKKEDAKAHSIFLNAKSSGERETDRFYSFAYLQSQDEVIENLAGTGLDFEELCANSMEIYDKIENYSLFHTQQSPQVEVKDYPKTEKHTDYPTLNYLYQSDEPQERYWVNQCVDNLKDKNLFNDEYLSRLEEEARVHKIVGERLDTCMFSYPIFLQHYINVIWDCGSTIGVGRGSACSALSHWLLGVTQLDPIVNGFPFWRYMNEATKELGDVDIDISPSLREKIFEEIRKQRGGETGVAQVCTWGTLGSRNAVLTAARGMGIDNDKAQYLSSMVGQERGFTYTLNEMINGNEDKGLKPNKTFLIEIGKYPGLLETSLALEGVIDHCGIHASGVIFEPEEDPCEKTAYMRAPSGALITQFSLHDAEWMGVVKFDFLVTQVQDIIIQWIHLAQEHNVIDPTLSIKEAYYKYVDPSVIPMDDDKLWDAIDSGNLMKFFQFEEQVGKQTLQLLRPRNVTELANCNSVMRLMAQEKGGETPSQRYFRMKSDMSQWYKEMNDYGLTQEEQEVLKQYYLPSYATPAQQEDLMRILMDPGICGFTLEMANNARRVCSKKKMDKIEALHEEVMEHATSPQIGKYVWETAIKNQLGYSFSAIHSGSYSYIGVQTAYLALYYNPIYWYCACLRVMSGLGEEENTNYDKTCRAVSEVQHFGINVGTIDINKSEFNFEPDEDNNLILYGMRALNGVGGDVTQQIIANRPYKNVTEFVEKNNPNKSVMISLIKAGAFDEFHDRVTCMRWYLTRCSEPKKKITLANFQGLIDKGLVDDNMTFCKRLYVFNKSLRGKCKHGDFYRVTGRYMTFYEQFFDIDELEIVDGETMIAQKKWQKMYTKAMEPAKKWIADEQEDILKKFNGSLFQEQWNKYALGTQLTWEMDSLGFYSHGHELEGVDKKMYGISNFEDLPEEGYRNSARIQGTVIAKNDIKSSVAVLTPECGVVDVKFNRDAYASYNRRISEINQDGTKTCIEEGWFSKGTLLFIDGYRRGNMFVARAPRGGKMLYKIVGINGSAVACVSERAE